MTTHKDSNNELKPCPFCGEAEKLQVCEQPQNTGWFIRCRGSSCYVEGPFGADGFDRGQAIKAWNTRNE